MSSSHEIDVKELLAKVDSGQPLLVLDVRNDEEYENWKIEGRRQFKAAHIPYFDFIEDEQAAVERLPRARGRDRRRVRQRGFVRNGCGDPARPGFAGAQSGRRDDRLRRIPRAGHGAGAERRSSPFSRSGNSTDAEKVVCPTLSFRGMKRLSSMPRAPLKPTNPF